MSMPTTDLVSILKTAIRVENNGYDTFSRFARETQDEHGKKMFEQLAKDELEHRSILQTQLENLSGGGDWASMQIPKSSVERLIPKIRDKERRIKGESGLGEIDALNTALDLERKAAAFFRSKADEVSDPNAKDLFIRLAEWEDSHFELIMAELDNIKNTGLWFGIPEFRMDGTF